jgi:hypothetical protein
MDTTIHHSHTAEVNLYKVAAITAAGLIGFFLLMKLVHLNTVVELRFLNIFIVLFGVRYILLRKREENGGKLEYLNGMMAGFMTAFLSAVIFAAFIFIYLNVDAGFMLYLKSSQPFGTYLTPASASLITVLEGAASGAILSFMLMHTINRDDDLG